MAHIVDLEDPLCADNLYNPVDTEGHLASTFLSALAATKGCGLFLLIENILKRQHISEGTARLALDLLRGINRQGVIVVPSVNDNPTSFVVRMLNLAKEIAEKANNENSPLCISAKRLNACLNAFKEDEVAIAGLESTWQDFSLHYYRERLYQFLRRRD